MILMSNDFGFMADEIEYKVKDRALLEKAIGYTFKDRSLLEEALTHSSYANEGNRNLVCNERMEFLGDSVLSVVSAEFLFTKFPDMPEGSLSKLRSSLVCTASLSGFARQIKLGDYLKLGKGEMLSGGSDRPSILEDVFEALIAAVYLDGGLEAARRHIVHFLESELQNHQINFKDYKSRLQEFIQQNPDGNLTYRIIGESGPDHDKMFEAEVCFDSNVIGRGKGKSKKQAEQEAAREALQLMGL